MANSLNSSRGIFPRFLLSQRHFNNIQFIRNVQKVVRILVQVQEVTKFMSATLTKYCFIVLILGWQQCWTHCSGWRQGLRFPSFTKWHHQREVYFNYRWVSSCYSSHIESIEPQDLDLDHRNPHCLSSPISHLYLLNDW